MKKEMPAWKKKRIEELRFKCIMYPLITLMMIIGLLGFILGVRNYIYGAERTGATAGALSYFCEVSMEPVIEPVEVETVAEPYAVDGVAVDAGFTYEDLYNLAKVIYCEGGTVCDDQTLSYIGSVVLNRVGDSRFPDTVREVIFQEMQYSTTWNGSWDKYEPDDRCLEIACELLNGFCNYGFTNLPADVIYQSNFQQGSETYLISNGLYFCK